MSKKKIRVAINGFGRIGRLFFKLAQESDSVEIVAINDLGDVKNMAYLLKYDSAQKELVLNVEAIEEGDSSYLQVGEKAIPFYSIREPGELPWGELVVDVVAECTGVFTSFEKSNAHLEAGAKRVVISAPVKDAQGMSFGVNRKGATVLMGVNDNEIASCDITSNASCTTNAGGIPLDIMRKTVGVESALLNTIHSYTASQSIVDAPRPGKNDYRKMRAGAVNIIPSSTGSAIATTKAIPDLENQFDGIALRVPVITGSIADITFISSRETSAEEVNNIFRDAAKEDRYQGLLRVEEDQIVSSDIIGDRHIVIIDPAFTRVVGKLVKIMVWYDNETGYSQSLLSQVEAMGQVVQGYISEQ
ncbi:MAG: type I glyceraldehyde-3-phosphate dehydrogenase [Patescibacteria group bacterium]